MKKPKKKIDLKLRAVKAADGSTEYEFDKEALMNASLSDLMYDIFISLNFPDDEEST